MFVLYFIFVLGGIRYLIFLPKIDENNIAGPDLQDYELKAMRKNAKSMLTLFTKAPLPRGVNSALLDKFGYASQKGNSRKELHTTIKAGSINTLRGSSGLKTLISKEKLVWSQRTIMRRHIGINALYGNVLKINILV